MRCLPLLQLSLTDFDGRLFFLLYFESSFLFSLEDVGWYELGEFVIEYIQNLARQKAQIVYLSWKVVVHGLDHALAH